MEKAKKEVRILAVWQNGQLPSGCQYGLGRVQSVECQRPETIQKFDTAPRVVIAGNPD
jgi:hypothetical protein